MRRLINTSVSLFFGFFMSKIGFPFYTWQFWVIMPIFAIVYCIAEEKLFPEKPNKNE